MGKDFGPFEKSIKNDLPKKWISFKYVDVQNQSRISSYKIDFTIENSNIIDFSTS